MAYDQDAVDEAVAILQPQLTELKEQLHAINEWKDELMLVVTQLAGFGAATGGGQPPTLIWEDDVESYSTLADAKADPPGYNEQTQGAGNVVTVSTDRANSGTKAFKFVSVDNAEGPTDKCGLVMLQSDFDPSFSFAENDILSFRAYFYMENPGDTEWPNSNEYISFEDFASGDGIRLGTHSNAGTWRFRRGQFGFTNETPAGQSAIPVDQWVKIELRIKMGILPTDDETNYPNAGVDFYSFDANDAGWYQIIQDDVIVGQASCTTILSGFTYNITFGRGAIDDDTTHYIDDILLQKPTSSV